MREINADILTETIARLAIEANCLLPGDVKRRIEGAREEEPWPTACGILNKIIENYGIAELTPRSSPIKFSY